MRCQYSLLVCDSGMRCRYVILTWNNSIQYWCVKLVCDTSVWYWYVINRLHTIRKPQWNRDETTKLVRATNSACFITFWEMFFCETQSVLFCQAGGFHNKLKGIFRANWRSRLRCKMLDNQRIVCSAVFVKFRKLMICCGSRIVCSPLYQYVMPVCNIDMQF